MSRDVADVLLRDAELLVTMVGEEIAGGWVAMREGAVTGCGASGSEPEARETVSARGCLVTPGLINTHHHMYQNLTRAFAPALDKSLIGWLLALYPLWQRIDEEAIYVSTWVALAELALGGCTTSTDHLYLHPKPRLIDAQIAAAAEIGMRFHPARGSYTLSQKHGGIPPDDLVEHDDDVLADCERLVERYHDRSPGSMLRIALAPCSLLSVRAALLEETARMGERLDVRLHTHLAEDADEVEFSLERFGCRPVEHMEAHGWGTGRAWVAHCILPNESEIARLGERRTGVAHCPSSNMILGGGLAPIHELRQAGSPVGLGCDGSSSADCASLWLESRTAMLQGKLRHGPGSMSARDVLEMGTVGGAACLGRAGELGTIEVGHPADLVAWSLSHISFSGAHTDLVEAWLRCGPVAARHTIVNGRCVVRDGAVAAPELSERLRRHGELSREWQHAAAR